MSIQLQPPVPLVSQVKAEPPTVIIKNEPPEEALEEEISTDIKNIDIVYHPLCEDLIKSETVLENILENKHFESVQTQALMVKAENSPFIKAENITQRNKSEDTSDENVSRGTGQGVVEVQGSNERFNVLQSEKQFGNFYKDLSDISRKAKCPNKTGFSECPKTLETSSCEKDKKKGNLFEVPVVPYSCEKCTFISENHSYFKQHKLSHKTKAEVDSRYLKYRCDKCKYKTCWPSNFKVHKLIHLKPEEIQYFYCYHCSYKSKLRASLQTHILCHFKNEDVSFHCYICDFVTLKRDLIIEHFKTHPKHHSKCDETEVDGRYLKYRCDKCKYKTYWYHALKVHKLIHLKPEEIQYFYCYHCSYKCKQKINLQTHIIRHFKNEDVRFHCYICDFVTLKRDLIIEHFKTHPKHHSKCDEIDYETYTKKQMRHCCEKCTYTTGKSSNLKLHQLTHKTKAEIDDRLLKYRCDKCKYKTYWCHALKAHKLTHLKPEEIHYFYCYHCSFKSKHKGALKTHIFRHFKNENVPFHCYICDFTTLKRNLIIEHFKKLPKHHSKCDEIDYKNQLEISYFYCYHCSYKGKRKDNLKTHIFSHFKRGEIPFHCYICDFTTLKRNLIIEHFKKHPKHHSKCDKIDYKNQLEISYFYCYHCSYKCKRKDNLKTHIFKHFKRGEIPFHCYICDFVTLKRESFKKHLKHHNKYDATEYRNQLLRFYKIL